MQLDREGVACLCVIHDESVFLSFFLALHKEFVQSCKEGFGQKRCSKLESYGLRELCLEVMFLVLVWKEARAAVDDRCARMFWFCLSRWNLS